MIENGLDPPARDSQPQHAAQKPAVVGMGMKIERRIVEAILSRQCTHRSDKIQICLTIVRKPGQQPVNEPGAQVQTTTQQQALEMLSRDAIPLTVKLPKLFHWLIHSSSRAVL